MAQQSLAVRSASATHLRYDQGSSLNDEQVWMWEAYGFSGGLVQLLDLLQEVGDSAYPHRSSALGVSYRSDELVALVVDGELWVPRFQLTHDYRVLGAVTRALRELRSGLSREQCALWFCTANLWLSGEAPMDLVQGAEEAVVSAARVDGLRGARH